MLCKVTHCAGRVSANTRPCHASAARSWPVNGDCYLMHKMHLCGLIQKVNRSSSKASSLRAAVLRAAVLRAAVLRAAVFHSKIVAIIVHAVFFLLNWHVIVCTYVKFNVRIFDWTDRQMDRWTAAWTITDCLIFLYACTHGVSKQALSSRLILWASCMGTTRVVWKMIVESEYWGNIRQGKFSPKRAPMCIAEIIMILYSQHAKCDE